LPFMINTETEFGESRSALTGIANPSVSSLPYGGFVVTWQAVNLGEDEYDIYGRVYKADGTPQGEEFIVNSEIQGDQVEPSVTGLTLGGFVVVWDSYGQDGSGEGVFGQMYNANGIEQGSEFLVSSELISPSYFRVFSTFLGNVVVTALTDGGFVVTSLTTFGEPSNKTFNSDGSVRSYYDPGTGLQYYAYNEGSDALVVFTDLSISDADNFNLSSASVSVSDFVTGDILGLADGFNLPSGIDVSYDPATGILSLTGSAGLADYEATLEHVVYNSVTENPDVSGLNPTRTIVAILNDGQDDSLEVSTTLSVIGTNVGTTVSGTSGSETLTGTSLDDLIEGGGGEDTLSGGLGADVFLFNAGESGNDVITDFSLAEGDILHLGDLLSGEEENSLDNYLNFVEVGGDTVISVDTNGDGSGTDHTITLTGVDLTDGGAFTMDQDVINDLLDHSALIVDQ
ncbi:MAG: type I secretion C-terminal target domain-containing protein, partial [Halopseudomonas aestusnigri]